MLFKKLVFQNYKTYYGVQELNLNITPSPDTDIQKNIILVGGLNGAGKTTIIRAIQDVLYGSRDISDDEYKKKFSNVINNTFFVEGGNTCSVSLFLETESGEEWQLQVKWYFDKRKVMTHFERDLYIKPAGADRVKKRKVENHEMYNKLIDRIMPFHASPFFIFDGEEVKEIILRQSSKEMRESIHKITGMHAYEQLIKDLMEANKEIDRELTRAVRNQEVGKLNDELEEVEEELGKYEKRQTVLRKKLHQIKIDIEKLHMERQDILLNNSKSREEFVKVLTRTQEQKNQAEETLNKEYQKNIISIILSDQITQLKKVLKEEKEYRDFKVAREHSLRPYRKFMDSLLVKEVTPPLTAEQIEQINKIGEEIWLGSTERNLEELSELHDLSKSDYNTLISFGIYNRSRFTELRNKITTLNLEHERIMMELKNAPESVDTTNIDAKLSSLSKEEGELSLRSRSTVKKVRSLEDQKVNIRNKISRISPEKIGNYEELQQQQRQVTATIKALKEFIQEDTKLKAKIIQSEFSNMLNKLFRKQDEFGKIEFDIETYSIRLYNDKMQEVSIQDRSAGEMQMISSALIWAMIKVSDLDLPVVIDTPLGRLDSYHRNQLIEHYYNHLSHQVIILSTDTEITKEYIDIMSKYTIREYMLDYDQIKKYTIIRDGYFNLIEGGIS